jgi:squalene-hopene/tetraprenyl-beta-curcumene cyclase
VQQPHRTRLARAGSILSALLLAGLPAAAQEEPGWVGLVFGLPPEGKQGASVVNVPPGSPADEAGVRVGDLIVAVNGKPLTEPGYLKGVLDLQRPGDTLRLGLTGADGEREAAVTVATLDLAALCAHALTAGSAFLASTQTDAGGWPRKGLEDPNDVPFSALCVRTLVGLPEALRSPHGEQITAGVAYLLRHQAPTGAIVGAPQRQHYVSYASALTLQALIQLDAEAHAEAIAQLQRYLVEAQLDDADGVTEYDFYVFGGWNIFDVTRPATRASDVSTTSYVLDALTAAGLEPDGLTARQALLFLERSQNLLPELPEDSPVSPKLYDGGFVTHPRESKAGSQAFPDGTKVYRPYGSATSDGLRSLLRLGVPKDDPRVTAASGWLAKYFHLGKNPGFPRREPGTPPGAAEGIYFYYLNSLTDALDLLGPPPLVREDGRGIDWPTLVARRLVAIQQPDGAWRGEINVMNEDDPNLATSFALQALGRCLRHLEGKQ